MEKAQKSEAWARTVKRGDPVAEKSLGSLAIRIEPETHQRLIDMRAAREIRDASTFIRQAIDEKLERMGEGGEASELLDLFGKLNDDGRAWLLRCASIAATCDQTRVIQRRNRAHGGQGDQ